MKSPQRMLLAAVAALSLAIGYGANLTTTPARAADDSQAKSAATFEVYKDKAGEFRWRLKASNGQNIATSGEGYAEKRSCLSAIESVKRNAPTAKIEEKE
ncbi:MAG TPA: DUF1508 domain-containing protein [Tepidisphaeraceae bacterium]|jgi:hypothetical protein|nr:DUF1508 domain-containing protein [Tepidisphaeraceae bacterium]